VKKNLVVFLILSFLIIAYSSFVSAADMTLETTLSSTIGYDYFGRNVASGDVNGDGYDDVIVSSSKGTTVGGSWSGRVCVFFGTLEGVPSTDSDHANITINGTKDEDDFGISIASGDVNNDGYDDIIVGAEFADPPGAVSAGQVFVFFGENYSSVVNEIASDYADIIINGTDGFDNFGHAVGSGNFNGDDYDDFVTELLS